MDDEVIEIDSQSLKLYSQDQNKNDSNEKDVILSQPNFSDTK